MITLLRFVVLVLLAMAIASPGCTQKKPPTAPPPTATLPAAQAATAQPQGPPAAESGWTLKPMPEIVIRTGDLFNGFGFVNLDKAQAVPRPASAPRDFKQRETVTGSAYTADNEWVLGSDPIWAADSATGKREQTFTAREVTADWWDKARGSQVLAQTNGPFMLDIIESTAGRPRVYLFRTVAGTRGLARLAAPAGETREEFHITIKLLVKDGEQAPVTQPATRRNSWTPGRFDGEIRASLATCVRDLRLGQTDLKDVAPKYSVDPGPALTWPQALAKADVDFKADPDKRALFLAKFIESGDPAERLADLKLPKTGLSLGTGSGFSQSYCLGVPKETQTPHAQTMPTASSQSAGGIHAVLFPKASAALHFFISNKALDRPMLEIFNCDFRGTRYTSVFFDMAEKLYGFTVEREPWPGITMTIGGNRSGENGRNCFYAIITMGKGPRVEELDFTPDMKIERRRITGPNTHEPSYVDLYKDDKPVRRNYYKTVHDAKGTSTVIDHSEDLKCPGASRQPRLNFACPAAKA